MIDEDGDPYVLMKFSKHQFLSSPFEWESWASWVDRLYWNDETWSYYSPRVEKERSEIGAFDQQAVAKVRLGVLAGEWSRGCETPWNDLGAGLHVPAW